MKTVLATTLALFNAAAALAHDAPLPHAHQGESTSWIPAALGLGAIVLIACATARLRAGRQRSK